MKVQNRWQHAIPRNPRDVTIYGRRRAAIPAAFPAALPSSMLLMLVLPLVAGLILLFLFLDVFRRGSHWQRLGVKGPRGWPLVGNMAQFALGRRSYGEVYAELYRQHSGQDYVGFYRLFNEPALLVRDQELLRQILVGNLFSDCADNAVYVDHGHRDILASFNPFLARGDRWRLLRADLVPLFTPSRLRQLLPHVTNACRLLREQLPRESFEAKEWATRYTLQVVASAVFGVDAHCLGVRSEEESGKNPWLQLLAPLFQPSSWSLLETVSLLHSPLLGRVLSYRYVPLPVQHWLLALVEARTGRDNLLHWLEAEGRRNLERVELEGHATTLVLEGYETSALLLACALYELARNEDIQRRLHMELDEQEGDLLDNVTLGKLRYTEAVLLETLRLHPAMQALQKRCTKSFTLPGGGPSVQEGTVLVLPVQAIQLDPELHPEPHMFRPERFLDQMPMGCRFLGFGAGPRMCPGQRLGLLQTKAALATLLQEHRILVQPGAALEVSPLTFLTASKGGIWLRLKRRSPKGEPDS